MASPEEVSPVALLVELQTLAERLARGETRNLESLLVRRTEILKDLLYFRHYGFRTQYLEDLVAADPNIAQMAQAVAHEEETANAITAFQDQPARMADAEGLDAEGMGEAGPDEGLHYRGYGGRRRS